MLYVMQQNRELIWLRLLHFEGICWETLKLLLRHSGLECRIEAVLFSHYQYVFNSHSHGRKEGQRNEFR
jgi:hypothetical protein